MAEPTTAPDEGPTPRGSGRRNALIGGIAALVVVLAVAVAVAAGGGSDGGGTTAARRPADTGASDSASRDDTDGAPTDPTSPTTVAPGTTPPPGTDPAPTTVPPDATTAPTGGRGTTGGSAGTTGGGTGAAPNTPPASLPRTPDAPPTTAPFEPRTASSSGVPAGPCTPTGPPKVASAVHDGPNPPGHGWQVLGASAGNCGNGGNAPVIQTSTRDTRVVFRSDASQFLVFLVDLDNPDSNAGYADVDCRSVCSDQGVLILQPGRYRVDVQATDGPWEVSVEEYR